MRYLGAHGVKNGPKHLRAWGASFCSEWFYIISYCAACLQIQCACLWNIRIRYIWIWCQRTLLRDAHGGRFPFLAQDGDRSRTVVDFFQTLNCQTRYQDTSLGRAFISQSVLKLRGMRPCLEPYLWHKGHLILSF